MKPSSSSSCFRCCCRSSTARKAIGAVINTVENLLCTRNTTSLEHTMERSDRGGLKALRGSKLRKKGLLHISSTFACRKDSRRSLRLRFTGTVNGREEGLSTSSILPPTSTAVIAPATSLCLGAVLWSRAQSERSKRCL